MMNISNDKYIAIQSRLYVFNILCRKLEPYSKMEELETRTCTEEPHFSTRRAEEPGNTRTVFEGSAMQVNFTFEHNNATDMQDQQAAKPQSDKNYIKSRGVKSSPRQ